MQIKLTFCNLRKIISLFNKQIDSCFAAIYKLLRRDDFVLSINRKAEFSKKFGQHYFKLSHSKILSDAVPGKRIINPGRYYRLL